MVVQISDIHCGPMFNQKIFHKAVKEINNLSPDVVVITGDLTEEGICSEFQQAEKELKRLRAKNIIYVSGNHDYRATGYLLFQKFFPFHQITEIDNTVIIVLSSARPDRDDGEVGHRQNLWLEDTLTKYKDYTKIVTIHHHIVPVPDTGADPITIIDAGDVLRSLTKTKANLVLCGHRHRPWQWQIENMHVVHAGSISCQRLRGFFLNSYNVIEIKSNTIKPRLKIVDHGYVNFEEIKKHREIFQPQDINQTKTF